MELFKFIRKNDGVGFSPRVGVKGDFVILNEVKDLDGGSEKEGFFAEDAQNDRTSTPSLRDAPLPTATLVGSSTKQGVISRDGGQRLRMGYEKIVASRRGTTQGRSLRKDGKNGTAGVPSICVKERFFAKDAQNDRIKTQDDKSQEGFFAREAQNDKIKTQNDRIQERFFAQDAQNDKQAGRHANPWSGMTRDGGLPLRMGKERIVASRCGTTQGRSLRKDGKNGTVRDRSLRVIVLILMLLVVGVRPVVGQVPPTRLFVNPTQLLIDTTISPTGVVSLEVADGVDIFAFDLFVQYDPALLYVSEVIHGEFLGMGLLCMDQINNPGLVHYNCTRFGVDTGVSGSGVLLTLTFEALGKGGDTTLSLEGSELYDWPDAQPIVLSQEDGAVSVRPYRTYLPFILTASGQSMEMMP